ncbi:FAD-binding domain-containing protein [Methylobacterium frigidaeris]|uniref:FAD-binding domain-containing protein n=1 Tax=Methylobacterium frigidaeris TaxID=2038277 RepID=UPI001EDCFEEE|nr:FAD-binding domain-containing protein [Methylobacterium frigidaeris]
MWFASIWIFSLRLPWELGAEFFLRRLLDGDPASNTLSWRWVAGLHTRGRPYLARRDNIRDFTEGRHDPAGLDEGAAPSREGCRPGRCRWRRPIRCPRAGSSCSSTSTT